MKLTCQIPDCDRPPEVWVRLTSRCGTIETKWHLCRFHADEVKDKPGFAITDGSGPRLLIKPEKTP